MPGRFREHIVGDVIVANWVTLDGVMQGPGRAQEDTRDGFTHGGWSVPYADDAMGAKMAELMDGGHAWLFGHRSYDDMLTAWNERGGPFKEGLNTAAKYVVTGNPDTELPWPNSTLLHDDVPRAVAELKTRTDTNLVIMGSGVLIRSLMAADLIDRYLLFIAPLVLGSGRRLFTDNAQASLRLVDSVTTPTGAIIVTYEPVR